MSAELVKIISTSTTSSKSKQKVHGPTHLYMNKKNFEEIAEFSTPCDNVQVLYLHENRIQAISNLEGFKSLTHLYLQWNKIETIDNLNCLTNLRKLYLGNNRINCLQNLEKLHNLKELHIEKQDLNGAQFTFDALTLKSLARTLEILNVTALGLANLEPVSVLFRLKHLIANGNCFEDAKEMGENLGRMIHLEKADLKDCPAQKDIHFRDKITAGSYNLQFLDGKFITPQHRTFIKRFEQVKSERGTKSETDTMCKLKTEPKDKMSSQSLRPQHSNEELDFRVWNSLNFIRKPVRRMVRKDIKHRPKSGYSLEGRNIVN